MINVNLFGNTPYFEYPSKESRIKFLEDLKATIGLKKILLDSFGHDIEEVLPEVFKEEESESPSPSTVGAITTDHYSKEISNPESSELHSTTRGIGDDELTQFLNSL